MRFSTRTRYGLRFLLRLAAQPKDSLLQLGQVAREENISSGYLEQIVRALSLWASCAPYEARAGATLWPKLRPKSIWKTSFCIWKVKSRRCAA
ncbi:Rrf2 family transcriptional regulator [Desulfovibrio sp.]|uniref:Rrf2 family transcriptional regulator n=1 Tax=Desulfovibrio sp. TaxID=885 RepID=UPI00258A74CB|nr:Rrf2 family transcriptional regulator [Desulfovibrio sp.]